MVTGKTVNRANVALVAIGVASLVLYGFGLRVIDRPSPFVALACTQGALYLIAAWIVLRTRPSRSLWIVVIIFAALFRLSVLFAPPYLSTDIFRYIWDGRVQAAGINPFRYVPADEALSGLRDEIIYPNINRRDYAPTIYPPVAQMTFFAVTRVSESVTWMKAAMVGFELVGLYALVALLVSFNFPKERVLLAAWHPLLVWEIAGNGHVDAMLFAFLALALLARRRGAETMTGVWLACAALIKLYPIVLVPAFYRRWGWKMPVALAATVVVAYLPYLSVGLTRALGFLPGYVNEERLQTGESIFILSLARRLFANLFTVPSAAFMVFAAAVLGAIAIGWLVKQKRSAEGSFIACACLLAAVFTALLSPHNPWYYIWLVPFLSLTVVPPLRPLYLIPLFYLTTSIFVQYLSWRKPPLEIIFISNVIAFVPSFALLGLTLLWKRRQDSAWQSVEAK
jgi:alpha-1,6-mannosyltransferase